MASDVRRYTPASPHSLQAVTAWALKYRAAIVEWLAILFVALLYAAPNLLNLDPLALQQTGEQSESATLPLLAEIGLNRYGQIPLWNPYMLTGFPHAGDLLMHFWHPVSTLPIMIWGGINGMKVSVFLAFLIAGWGQWFLAHQVGLRGMFRLWAALLFMLSGGLGMLWRSGWYELLLGAAWFPWCFGAFWWMLQRKDRASIGLSAVCVAMVLTTGGGYYPLYLGVMLTVLGGLLVLFAPAAERWVRIRRALAMSVLAVGLSAVMLLPLVDGYIYTIRDSGVDVGQEGSQPIPYALINYIVSELAWHDATILGTKGGWNWFYIGWLPVAALSFAFLALRARRYRLPIVTLGILLLVILAWQANKYMPVHLIYELVPYLYRFRFPGRLLIIAASPLLILAALGLQYVYTIAKARASRVRIAMSVDKGLQAQRSVSLRPVVTAAFLLIAFFSIRSAYQVNQGWNFSGGTLEAKSFEALRFIKSRDAGLFYTNIGGGFPWFDWMPAAYILEMPVINFRYNRGLLSMDEQSKQDAPFRAEPRYILSHGDEPRPKSAQALKSFDDVELVFVPDVLPFAFGAPFEKLLSGAPIAQKDVAALDARLDGPNRVIVQGELEQDQRLVVLVSDYPGWHVSIDGVAAPLQPVNGYLGAAAQPGAHTFTFEFRPVSYEIGLVASLLSVLAVASLAVMDVRRPR